MKASTKRWVEVAMGLAILIAGVRFLLVMRNREKPGNTRSAASQPAPPLNANYYVVPKKLYPFDLKSARQLTQQPVWVKEGYRYTYYPYDAARHHADYKTEAGTLAPLEKLDIKDVVADAAPSGRLVAAIFDRDGKSYAVQIGTISGKEYRIYSDEMFFIQDPRQLYNFWPGDVWDAIAKHEVRPGMDELQADFAVGMGIPQRQEDAAIKTVDYPNGGKPLQVTFRDGKAVDVKPGPSSAAS
jgi:hypothetical protein